MRMMTTANILTVAPGAKLTVLCCSVQAVITCSVSVTRVPWGNIHTCVTCVNMGMCHHQGPEHLVSALLWAFDYLPCVSAFSTVCWNPAAVWLRVLQGVTVPSPLATEHWAPHGDLQHGQPWWSAGPGPGLPVTTAARSQGSVVSGPPRRQHLPCTADTGPGHWIDQLIEN